MDRGLLSAVLSLIILLFVGPILASGDPLAILCEPTYRNYTLNSPFENNLKFLLHPLPSNTSVSGFYDASNGEGQNQVYGQALCRGDVDSIVCRYCIKSASQELLKQCRSEYAMIWFELCQVRYSIQMFFSMNVYTGKYPEQNNLEKNLSSPVPIDKVLLYLMNKISGEAASDPSKRMFATGEIQFSGKNTIYGLVQCTRDISGDSCNQCLVSALGDLRTCCSSREGGTIVSRNCNMRFELHRFYNASSFFLTYPSSKGTKWKIWMFVMVTCISISVLGILIGSCAVYHRRKKKAHGDDERSRNALSHELTPTPGVALSQDGKLVSSEELPFMDLSTILAATDDFSDSNKLGQGGFGAVFKGVLPDGKEVAVKRLSRKSWQGLEEFKNEVILIAQLRHRNLVKLIGLWHGGRGKTARLRIHAQ